MQRWPSAALEALREEASVVRVLVASLRGSAPREAGACMLVTRDGIVGTIGGGHLEFQAIAAARRLLPQTEPAARLQRYVLGIELGQCCGGVVELWMERYTAADRALLEAAADTMRGTRSLTLVSELEPDQLRRSLKPLSPDIRRSGFSPTERRTEVRPATVAVLRSASRITLHERLADDRAPLWLFGAGHVGQALVRVLSELPLRITWIDSRVELFPSEPDESLEILTPASPVASLQSAPPGARYIVMTHDHALDYALCRAILARDDIAYAGLIGSHSKGARFRSRLLRDGLSADQVSRLVCPIGIDGIASKLPAAIAVGIAAQLLQGMVQQTRLDSTVAMNCSEECATCQQIP